jgi:hypothetical protein
MLGELKKNKNVVIHGKEGDEQDTEDLSCSAARNLRWTLKKSLAEYLARKIPHENKEYDITIISHKGSQFILFNLGFKFDLNTKFMDPKLKVLTKRSNNRKIKISSF